MAPSINVVDTDVHAEGESKKKKRKSKDSAALQENADVCDDSSKKKKKKKKMSVNSAENDSNPGGEETELIEIVAKYLSKRGLSKTLSSFISETQCENSWKLQTTDLEDIFNQYLNQESEKSVKFKVKDRDMEQGSDHLSKHRVHQNSSMKFQEQEIEGKNGITKSEKVVNSTSGTLTESVNTGASEQGIGRSDASDDSSDAQDKAMQVQKKKTHKGTSKETDPNTKRRTEEKESGVPTSANRENGSLNKGIAKSAAHLEKSENILKVEESLQESLEGPKEKIKKKKKKKSSEGKDSEDNYVQKISADKGNRSSTKDDANPSKASQKSENILDVDEFLQRSLEVPKEKKRKKKNPVDEDNDKQDSAKETKKEKKASKKKLHSSSSHETNDDTSKNSVKDSIEDIDKSLVDTKNSRKSQAKEVDELEPVKSVNGSTDAYEYQNGSTPGQKGVIEMDGEEINKSSKSKQKSDVSTAAKAFQRVKVQEVEFADPRLQNNSYWAKGGAEIGYGAKAQEVLGQVKGKDFRHEKTKKKRGSYKGGLIDLQAHSIKFNYSDEE